jgi:hypothetical protein
VSLFKIPQYSLRKVSILFYSYCTELVKVSKSLNIIPKFHKTGAASTDEAVPVTGLDRPWGFQKVKASRFWDNRLMKVVRLSALRTGRLYPPTQEISLVLISVRGWVDPRALVRPVGSCRCKFPMAASGIEPATFRVVIAVPQQLRHCVPLYKTLKFIIILKKHNLPLFWTWWIRFTRTLSLRSISIHCYHWHFGLQSGLFLSRFIIKNLYASLLSSCVPYALLISPSFISAYEQYFTPELRLLKPKHIANKRSNNVPLCSFVMSLKIHIAIFWVITCTVPDYTVSSLRSPCSKW